MNTTYELEGGLSVTIFSGGTDRGSMLQINDPDGRYVQLTPEQFMALSGWGIKYIGEAFAQLVRLTQDMIGEPPHGSY